MSRQNNGVSRKDVEAQLKAVNSKATPGNEKAQQNDFESEKSNTRQQGEHMLDNQTISDTGSDAENADDIPGQVKDDKNQQASDPRSTSVIKTQSANVIVKYINGREGILILNKQSEHNDMAYVTFNNDSINTLVKFSDLKILYLKF